MAKPMKCLLSLSTSPLVITTPRLRLIAGTPAITASAVENKSEFSRLLEAKIPHNWPEELMVDAEPWIAQKLAQEPDKVGWYIWYVILPNGSASEPRNSVIGTVGLKGLPNADGMVEMGWGCLEQFRNHGYLTEAAQALMEWALLDPRVKHVTAQTFPHLKPSIRVMEKLGMIFEGPGEEVGVIRFGKRN